jgi:hypothetical protein
MDFCFAPGGSVVFFFILCCAILSEYSRNLWMIVLFNIGKWRIYELIRIWIKYYRKSFKKYSCFYDNKIIIMCEKCYRPISFKTFSLLITSSSNSII